jgi:hypothetical protein
MIINLTNPKEELMKRHLVLLLVLMALSICAEEQGWRTWDYNLDRSGLYPYPSLTNDLSDYGLRWSRPGHWPLSGHLIADYNNFQIACVTDDSLVIFNHLGACVGGFLLPESNLSFNCLCDMDGDGLDDIFLTTPYNITTFQLWIYTPGGELLRHFERTGGNIMNYEGDQIIWAGNGSDSGWFVLGVIDPAPGGAKKIVMCLNAGYSLEPRGIELLDYNTQSTSWYFAKGGGGGWTTPVSDLFGDGRYEILPHWFTPHNGGWGRGVLGNAPLMVDGDNWSVMIRDDGEPLFAINRAVDDEYYHRVADMDQDGLKEIVAFETHAPWYPGDAQVHLLNPENGEYLQTTVFNSNQSIWGYFGDVNNDGFLELAITESWESASIMHILDRNMTVLASGSDLGRPCSMNDINGDGKAEILAFQPVDTQRNLCAYDENLNEIWRYDFPEGSQPDWCDTRITDLDQDGYNELFLSRTDDRVYVIGRPTQVAVGNGCVAHTTLSLRNDPNPFNPVTTLSFVMPREDRARLSIFNMRGQLVTTLVDGVRAAGMNRVVWNGTDNRGAPVVSGVYFCRIEACGEVSTQKALLLK